MYTEQQALAHQDVVLEQRVAQPISQGPDRVDPPFGILSAALRAIGVRMAYLAEQAATTELAYGQWQPDLILGQLIGMVASIVDARDHADVHHAQRVATYAAVLGQVMGLKVAELTLVHTAGLLHDLGKVGIPEAILYKPAPLTADEYGVVKQHPFIGERILAAVQPLREVACIVGQHHERYDGQGYPRGIPGPAISRGGRILAVADALDAILSNRRYGAGHGLTSALVELDRCAGSQFDPAVVAAVHRVVATRKPAFFSSSRHHAATHHLRPAGADALAWECISHA